MKIEDTGYYLDATEYFRRPPADARTKFGEEGFTYISPRIAIGFRRASKSNYEITVMFGGAVATVIKHNIREAAAFAERTVQRAESP